MNNEIIIFCQAPSDIQYFLTLYEKYNSNSRISLYVINVENLYKFIINLNLNLKCCVFIPYSKISFKNPLDLIYERKRINSIIKQQFESVTNNNVYFFSVYEDWLTAAFIKSLSKNNIIYYIDYYDFSADLFELKPISFKLYIHKLVFWLITGIFFKVKIQEKLPEFDYLKYNIIKQKVSVDCSIYLKYQFKVSCSSVNKRKVFYFISPCEDSIFDSKTYDNLQIDVIKRFKDAGWLVYIKGHPRIGVPKEISKYIDGEISSYIPAEFINIDDFDLVIGIITSSLAYFSLNTNVNALTLINIFDFTETHYKKMYIDYLSKLSNNKLRVINNFTELDQIIK